MQKDTKGRVLGIAAIFAALLLSMANSFSITSFTISDVDPTTYTIVVMLMLFLFLAFYAKDDKLRLQKGGRNMAYGALLFAFYFVLLAYSRVALSYLFLTYRVDLLLLPVLLLALVVTVFGFNGVRRMRAIFIYALLASPIVLLPIIGVHHQFAVFNSYIVYDTLRAIGIPVVHSGLLITAPSSYSISIAETCADIGAFIALLMFLLPIAYLFDGKLSKKIAWVAAAIALMFLLNIARMSSIALIWAYYGIGNAIATFHIFIGQILFYATIVVMFVLSYKFGLGVPGSKRRNPARKQREATAATHAPQYALCMLFGIIALAFSLPYGSSLRAPLNGFSNAQDQSLTMANIYALNALENAHMDITQLGYIYTDAAFALGNSTDYANQTYVLINYTNRPALVGLNAQYNSSGGIGSLLLRNGITLNSELLESYNSTFAVSYFTVPYNDSGSWLSIRYEFIRQINQQPRSCDVSPSDMGLQNYIQSYLYNLLNRGMQTDNGLVCPAFSVAKAVNSAA